MYSLVCTIWFAFPPDKILLSLPASSSFAACDLTAFRDAVTIVVAPRVPLTFEAAPLGPYLSDEYFLAEDLIYCRRTRSTGMLAAMMVVATSAQLQMVTSAVRSFA